MKADLQFCKLTKITLIVHQGLGNQVMEILPALGINYAFVENARCVRQNMNQSFFGLPSLKFELSDAATEIFRMTVASDTAPGVLCCLIEKLELKTPGRGAVFSQDIDELSCNGENDVKLQEAKQDRLLSDLMLITGIQSKHGSGQTLFKVALKLGVGVPVVGLGTGTGIRDRMGLLRVTISPEKELVYLMVPAHDAQGLQSLLIEEGHLDRPGGGFLYQTPIRAGMVDPLIRIGRQEHAASIEQIIAAIDDLKKSTAWRKRFFGMEKVSSNQVNFTHREISFFCREGSGDSFVEAAMQAGAGGATVSRLRLLQFKEGLDRSVPFEHGVLCVTDSLEQPVLDKLREAGEKSKDTDWSLHSLLAASIFTYKRS